MNRRDSLALLLGSASIASAGLPAECTAAEAAALAGGDSVARRLRQASPREQLRALIKMFVSLEPETIWYWYTGVIDAARADAPVVPLVACDTLIRREVLPQPDGSFGIRTFEANYYRRPSDWEPLRRMQNPLNGREVEPLHYREGPHVLVMAEDGQRFVDGAGFSPAEARAAGVRSPRPLVLPWYQSGPMLWTARQTYSDVRHPLDVATWPLEASGQRLSFGSFSNYIVAAADLDSSALARTDTTFTYQALMSWWPWLLMGQTPGQLLWRAHGRKLRSLDELPAEARAGFEQVHPRIFASGLPWTEPDSMWKAYLRNRKPAKA